VTGGPRRLLARLLPEGTGQAALADLEHELAERRARRGPRSWDPAWFLIEGLRVAVRLRLARARTRADRAMGPLSGLGRDARLAARSLARSPLLVLTAAGILALGVAAPTIMFSLVRAIGAELPVPDPDALVHVGYTTNRSAPSVQALTPEAMAHLRADPPSSGPVAAHAAGYVDLAGAEHPERVMAGWVTPDFLRVLEMPPLFGRDFAPADAGPDGSPVVLVSERLWRERFGSDPALVGSELRVEGTRVTVIGVVPTPLRLPSGADVWIPVEPGGAHQLGEARIRWFDGVARLPSGTARQAAMDELQARAGGAVAAAPQEVGEGARAIVRPYREELTGPETSMILAAMLTLAGLVLLIACANVANLLLARSITRRRELAVRVALGASRLRIAVHQLAESLAVALLGGVVGCALAVGGIVLAERMLADELAWWMELRLDASVLAVAFGLIGAAGVFAGLLPALHAARSDPEAELRGGARAGDGLRLGRLSRGLVVAEIAFSAAVLVVSGLMLRGASTFTFDDGTQHPAEIMVGGFTLPANRPSSGEGRLQFHRTLLEEVAGRPGVEAAALTAFMPGVWLPRFRIEVDGADGTSDLTTHVVRVSPGYFAALGAPLVRGRDFTWRDGVADPPVAIVNEAFARTHLTERDPLGTRVRLLPPAVDDTIDAVVVGVAPALGIVDRERRLQDALYIPSGVTPARGAYVLMRAAPGREPPTLLPELRSALAALDPDRPLHSAATLTEHQRSARLTEWFFAGVFAVFGLAGLFMACAGLYAVIAFTVGRRRREVGVRVALGAGPRSVAWTIGRGAVWQLGLGLVLGLGLAALGAPAFGQALMGASPHDPLVYGGIAGILGLAALFASAVPTARALRVPPSEALRIE
jgi:putative ABC transport system permease protein